MHLRIRHEISCRFGSPARNLVSILRLSPRSHEGQHVTDWRLDADIDCSLKAGRDEFGNLTHTFSAKGPLDEVRILAAGDIDTFDTAGIVRGTVDLLPHEIFLRDTPMTVGEPALRRFAEGVTANEVQPLGKLHALLEAVNSEMRCDPSLDLRPAGDAFADKNGNAASHAHVFIACARHIGIPSRFVSGYLMHGPSGKAACHAWAEAFVPGLGWVGFDTVNNLCPKGEHVRCAAGFDALGAAFVRGMHPGNTTHVVNIAALA